MASKRRSTKLAMKTEIIRKNKMEAMKKQKILYLVWTMFIKTYFSHKVSKHGTRIKTDKTWGNQGYSGTPEDQFRSWIYKNSETAGRYSRPATPQNIYGGQDCIWYADTPLTRRFPIV